MAGEWRPSTWGEEIVLEYGKALRGHDISHGNVRVYGSNGPIGWTSDPLAPGPGVILGRKGAYRGVEYSSAPFFVIDTAYYVSPKTPDLDMRWLYYAIKHYKLGEIDDGSPIPSTTRAAVYVRDLLVPPLSEQRAIAHILGALDDKIDVNRHLIQVLEDLIRLSFEERFSDRERAGVNGWRESTIGEEASIYGGSTPRTSRDEYWRGGTIAWATPRDLSRLSSPVLFDTGRHITESGLRQISSGLLPVGTVLLSSRAPIGYLAIAEVPVAINQGFIALVCDKALPNLYIWQWIHNHLDDIKARANGTTFLEISKASFRPMTIRLPPQEVVVAWHQSVQPIYEALVNCERETAVLCTLRDTLLPRLISGELRVPDVERVLERFAS